MKDEIMFLLALATVFILLSGAVYGLASLDWQSDVVTGTVDQKAVVDTPGRPPEFIAGVRLFGSEQVIFIFVSEDVFWRIEEDYRYEFRCSHSCLEYGEVKNDPN